MQKYNEENKEVADRENEDITHPDQTAEKHRPERKSLEDPTPDGKGGYVLTGMYKSWFLSYASYVILERAVPHITDGLKPVQRRILYTMSQMEDRLIKVANIVGQAMQLHPHGDASIGDALVQLGQKELLIDTQGNWGNILTGDGAAAARYIEARLMPIAKQTLFSPKITEYKPSYDGANKEPVSLPVKFPLLLAQGAEGIAVGLSCKILPHNVRELLEACIQYLQGQDFRLYPDFPTGGLVEVERYNDGERGGQIKVRAQIEKRDAKTLAITEIPYTRTTATLIESILRANDKGNIKIKKIDDKTAATANIEIQLAPGTSADKTIDALYAFTDCEVSISPNCCVILEDKPAFLSVSDILRDGCERTMVYIRQELNIRLGELEEKHLMNSLEQLFITRRIYKDKEFEGAKDLPTVLSHIRARLSDVIETMIRPVTDDDLKTLLDIRMARILRFNEEKSKLLIQQLEDEMQDIRRQLADIRGVTIAWYQGLLDEYGDKFPRRTRLQSFDTIEAAKVVEKNEKLYVNREEGFIGTALKKDEYVCDVSAIDDVIVFLRSGSYQIIKVSDKAFVGKDIIHVARWIRNDNRTIYNAIYRDGKDGVTYIKRFNVQSAIRDRAYDLTQGKSGSKVLYFSANPNGEAEIVKVVLRPKAHGRQRQLIFEKDFADIIIKGRSARGNLLTKGAVFRVTLKEQGASTLGGREVWFDWDVFRINYDGSGEFIGEFKGDDRVLVILKSGEVYTTSYSDTNHFERNILRIEQYDPTKVWTLVYFDDSSGYTYIKRFGVEEDTKRENMLQNEKNRLILLTDEDYPRLQVDFGGADEHRPSVEIEASDFIGEKSIRAKGKRLSTYEVLSVSELEPRERPEDEVEDVTEEPEIDQYDEKEDEENSRLLEEVTGQQRLVFDTKDEEDENDE